MVTDSDEMFRGGLCFEIYPDAGDNLLHNMVSHLFENFFHTTSDPKILCMPSPTHNGAVESADPVEIAPGTVLIANLFNGGLIKSRLCTDLDVERELNVFKVDLA